MINITAGIVLFNPNIARLDENIRHIISQVTELILVDNGSENIKDVKKIYSNRTDIIIIENKSNKGIAYALNQIMFEADKNLSKWCLLLDQDTVCPPNLIDLYLPYVKLKDVAVITPAIIDRNKNDNGIKSFEAFKFIDKCITSASLNSVDIWNEIGGFDNVLFIDAVDHEYCIRLKKYGYKILKVNEAIILHEIGRIKVHKFLLWNIDIYNHSAFRKYYISRNIIYVNKKYNGVVQFISYLRVLKQGILVVFYEKDKKNKLKALYKGTIDGINMGKKLEEDSETT